MKKTIYISLDVEADSHQEAEQKIRSIFQQMERVAPPESGVKQIINTYKFINKVKI